MHKFLLTTVFLVAPAISMAQGYGSGRAQSWDFSIAGIYQYGDSSGGQGGSSLEVDSALGLGFNIGYNFYMSRASPGNHVQFSI